VLISISYQYLLVIVILIILVMMTQVNVGKTPVQPTRSPKVNLHVPRSS